MGTQRDKYMISPVDPQTLTLADSVDVLPIAGQVKRALNFHNIMTLRDLVARQDELLTLSGFGKKSLKELALSLIHLNALFASEKGQVAVTGSVYRLGDSVDVLPISKQAINSLKKGGVTQLQDLIGKECELPLWRGFGDKSYQVILPIIRGLSS